MGQAMLNQALKIDRWEYESPVGGLSDWALLRNGREDNDLWVVVLHGHGAAGDQLFTRDDLKPRERQIAELGLGLLCPNLRGNAWMSPAAVDDLHFLLNRVRERRGARRFVFCSGSMGGTGNLIYAIRHPEDVAGVVALCPATDIGSYYAWAAARGDETVIAAIREAFDYEPTITDAPTHIDSDAWRAAGRFDHAGLAAIMRDVRAQVITPCGAKVLSTMTTSHVPLRFREA